MHLPQLRSAFLLTLLIASSAAAVPLAWVPIGNPGNVCDTQPPGSGGSGGCFGGVGYEYNIGTYEVTNAQYAEFLNAKATADPLELYNTSMGSGLGGITQAGAPGSYTYSTISGRGDMPVNYVSLYDALRFANWLNNGQGNGDTESGAYTLDGTATPSIGFPVTRNAGAMIFLTSQDEWYKAAYHDALNTCVGDYCDYPARFDAQTICATPTATANRANCNIVVGDLTNRGSYTGSASPYGTFDQGGNVWEWNESGPASDYGIRGGSYNFGHSAFAAAGTGFSPDPALGQEIIGFRLVMIPEPGTGLLVIAGLLGLAGWRREHA